MIPSVIQSGRVSYAAIHFSDRFPVVRTACGCVGPSAARWRFVTCLPCLDAAPADPRIAARRADIVRESSRSPFED